MASLLLTIGLSIFRIALKELAISTATRQSIHAFYAADSGRECALYWDNKEKVPYLFNSYISLAPKVSGGEIFCGGMSINLALTQSFENPMVDKIESFIPQSASINNIISVSADLLGPNFYVLIDRTKVVLSPVSKVFTTIKSYGQDSVGGDRVQRAIIETY